MGPITVVEEIDEEKYRGQWLVIEADTGKIMSSHPTFEEAEDEARKEGIESPRFHHVQTTNNRYTIIRK